MKRMLVRYRVKPERAQENRKLIETVFSQLREAAPAGLGYASFQLEDGVSFVHMASIDTEDDSNPLAVLDAFKAFTRDIQERCDEPPLAMGMTEIGAYRFFAE